MDAGVIDLDFLPARVEGKIQQRADRLEESRAGMLRSCGPRAQQRPATIRERRDLRLLGQLLPMLDRALAMEQPEPPREVERVREPDLRRDLLDAEVAVAQQVQRLAHAHALEVLHR